MLSPYEYPVDRVIGNLEVTRYSFGTNYRYMGLNPNLPIEEIQGLHDSGLSTDEDGETIVDTPDSEIPFGWRIIEADDPLILGE
jgi:hypothetical protein